MRTPARKPVLKTGKPLVEIASRLAAFYLADALSRIVGRKKLLPHPVWRLKEGGGSRRAGFISEHVKQRHVRAVARELSTGLGSHIADRPGQPPGSLGACHHRQPPAHGPVGYRRRGSAFALPPSDARSRACGRGDDGKPSRWRQTGDRRCAAKARTALPTARSCARSCRGVWRSAGRWLPGRPRRWRRTRPRCPG